MLNVPMVTTVSLSRACIHDIHKTENNKKRAKDCLGMMSARSDDQEPANLFF
jgi:hypothetical protein